MLEESHPRARFIYISNPVWAGIKQQATLEGKSVSALIEFILADFFEAPFAVDLPERRSLSEEEALMYRARAGYIGDRLWQILLAWSGAQNKSSKSALIEVLVRRYLGLDVKDDPQPPKIKVPENGFVIDLDRLKRQHESGEN